MKNFIVFLIAVTFVFSLSGCLPALRVNMYSLDGTVATVFSGDVDEYKEKGWYETPVTRLYNLEGESKIVSHDEAQTMVKNGWYNKPVARLYNIEGVSQVVYSEQVESELEKGWYQEPVALMNSAKEEKIVALSEAEALRNEGWFFKEYYNGLYDLGYQLKDYIAKRSGKFGIYIKNLNTGEFVLLNDNQYYSASIIKLFVMAGIYSEIEKGNLEKTPLVERYLNSMITVSDNLSSNQLVNVLGHGNYRTGFDIENEHTKSIGCINTQHKSLFIGCGYYASYGVNRVSPYDCGILLEKIYNRTLVSPRYSDEMLALLKNQKRRNKIPFSLPKGTVTANKTGETSRVQSDVGIVYSPNCDYIICVITNLAPGGIRDISNISLMTYEYFNKTEEKNLKI